MKGEPKQVIILRKDLSMRKGKMIAQGAHASLKACLSFARFENTDAIGMDEAHMITKIRVKELILDITDPVIHQWWTERFKKVVVYVESEEALIGLYHQARDLSLPCSLIKDAGDTEFHGVPTYTAVAIGPGKEEVIDQITGELPLL